MRIELARRVHEALDGHLAHFFDGRPAQVLAQAAAGILGRLAHVSLVAALGVPRGAHVRSAAGARAVRDATNNHYEVLRTLPGTLVAEATSTAAPPVTKQVLPLLEDIKRNCMPVRPILGGDGSTGLARTSRVLGLAMKRYGRWSQREAPLIRRRFTLGQLLPMAIRSRPVVGRAVLPPTASTRVGSQSWFVCTVRQ
ncbi:hypothetical protein O7631_18440 [Micromonospora sp. WMMD967]|uniref:hypothetical protein n=1 Tax=Micromonospora sp. WMMD967 TaxID=3016101 RepID=UPI002416CFAD|nr:hypothetical protein [Micromonospora sp. WMMD967]MDG4838496.1 hypothetical protein [Micromonospora sp. WMMD967]